MVIKASKLKAFNYSNTRHSEDNMKSWTSLHKKSHSALNIITGCLKTLLGIHRTELSVDVVVSNRLESVKYAVGFVMVYKDNEKGLYD
ncbi:hypothetical protein DAPPUDRAFT_334865 [Daphnia pulex]|uniref:Uncharacterized protein n=1 Tax=Daphnia pulex TaxID=6669 RepID=E9HWK6_DAPPU|nr:hypothetical protein DAPPUDRAFT_334865 [Daphnia pulex]|eukprot:EFX63876.1 hypothetical protein DAPPUDRAFT_334865 [Daphnia pulex]